MPTTTAASYAAELRSGGDGSGGYGGGFVRGERGERRGGSPGGVGKWQRAGGGLSEAYGGGDRRRPGLGRSSIPRLWWRRARSRGRRGSRGSRWSSRARRRGTRGSVAVRTGEARRRGRGRRGKWVRGKRSRREPGRRCWRPYPPRGACTGVVGEVGSAATVGTVGGTGRGKGRPSGEGGPACWDGPRPRGQGGFLSLTSSLSFSFFNLCFK